MKPRAVERQTRQAENQEGLQKFIQKRAHELYLSRGRAPGHEMDDWLQAEREVKAKPRQHLSEG